MALTTLEKTRMCVEIAAIVVAGGWTYWEFGYKRSEVLKEGQAFAWATASLDADIVSLDPTRAWAGLRLTMTNASRRPVKPLLIAWTVMHPPDPDSVAPRA